MEEMNFYNRHYITVDEENRITDGWSDGLHPERDTSRAILINERGGYQFRLPLADGLSEENPALYDFEQMIPLYRWDGAYAVPRTEEEIELEQQRLNTPSIEEIRSFKEAELSSACNITITRGMDVTTSQGTEHFSLEETDQINLTTALEAIKAGATEYPYHADSTMCRMFTAEELTAIAQAATQHKLYHTTLCNHLLTWVRRAETIEEINSIMYSEEGLPEDLATNMTYILTMSSSL